MKRFAPMDRTARALNIPVVGEVGCIGGLSRFFEAPKLSTDNSPSTLGLRKTLI